MRPGFEVGYNLDKKYYVNNHLMFKILVHESNGQYSAMLRTEAELEAAAAVEVRARAGGVGGDERGWGRRGAHLRRRGVVRPRCPCLSHPPPSHICATGWRPAPAAGQEGGEEG